MRRFLHGESGKVASPVSGKKRFSTSKPTAMFSACITSRKAMSRSVLARRTKFSKISIARKKFSTRISSRMRRWPTGSHPETGYLYFDAKSVVDTSATGGAFQSAAIQSSGHRALCRRRLWRKSHPRLEPLTATLARKAHRPVQWVLTREEVFLDGPLPCRGREDQNRGQEGRHDCRAPG